MLHFRQLPKHFSRQARYKLCGSIFLANRFSLIPTKQVTLGHREFTLYYFTMSENTAQPETDISAASSTPRTKNKYLKWLLALTVIYTLYFAQSLIIPVVLTSLVALLLSPLVNFLSKFFIPRGVSAVVLLAALITPFTFLGIELAEPVQRWAKLLPELSLHIDRQIESISDSLVSEEAPPEEVEEKSGFSLFGWFSDEEEEQPVNSVPEEVHAVKERIKQGSLEIMLSVLAATPVFAAQLFASLILILFLLIYSPSLFDAFVSGLSKKSNKDRALVLKGTIQRQLSQYVINISVVNICLGLATALALHLYGMQDALLWGVLVGMLNFIPYIGMLFGSIILAIAGAVQYGLEPVALIPLGIYFVLNLIESQFVTPLLLSNQMQVNPLVTIFWLLICGWLWGITGVLIAVPLLVCIKLTLAQLKIWPQWLKVIEAR